MNNNNTAHFGLTDTNVLVNLGTGADTAEVANLLGDVTETIADSRGERINIVALFNINDLYRLRGEFTDALNSLDNESLAGNVLDYAVEAIHTD